MKALFTVFAVAALCGTAVAGDDEYKDHSKKSAAAKFEALDTDKDQRLSKTEAQAETRLSAQFSSVDQNSDGYVSKSEFTASVDPRTTTKDKSYE